MDRPSPTLPLNFFVDPECGDIAPWAVQITRLAAALTRDEMRGRINGGPTGHFHLYRGPHKVYRLTLTEAAAPARLRQSDMEKQGPALWNEMHRGMLTLATPEERKRMVDRIHAQLPCGACKAHFTELKKDADYSTAEKAFTSSWRWQNAVRRLQGKPEMGFEEAVALYRPK